MRIFCGAKLVFFPNGRPITSRNLMGTCGYVPRRAACAALWMPPRINNEKDSSNKLYFLSLLSDIKTKLK